MSEEEILNELESVAPAAPAAKAGKVAPTRAAAKTADKEPEKKPVGRPRKKCNVARKNIRGILPKPEAPGNIVELSYSHPIYFVKICKILKGYKVSEVELCFSKDGMQIKTQNKDKSVDIFITIAGKCLDSYYCEAPIRAWVKLEQLEDAFSGIASAANSKCTWNLNKENDKYIYIIISDSTDDSIDIYDIEIFTKENPAEELKLYDDSDYPLRFKILSTKFKKHLTELAKKKTSALNIQKCGDKPLQFSSGKSVNTTQTYTQIFQSDSKIGLESTIAGDDILLVSIPVVNLSPIGKNSLGDMMYIAIDRHRRATFQTVADLQDDSNAVSVKIFTEIVK